MLSGRAFIAASDLYKKDPYARAERAEARVAVLREALAWYADPQHHDEDLGCGEWKVRGKLFEYDEGLNAQQAISTLDPAAERLLAERKLLRRLRDQVNWFAAHPNGWTADTFEGTRDALTALHEFDDKETK